MPLGCDRWRRPMDLDARVRASAALCWPWWKAGWSSRRLRVGGNGRRWRLARFAPLVEGRGQPIEQTRSITVWTALLPHAAREHLAGRAGKRSRVPSAFGPRSSPIENPLQGIGPERPIARNGKLSLSLRDVGRHAAPPRWRRTGGERCGEKCGEFRSSVGISVPFRSPIAGATATWR